MWNACDAKNAPSVKRHVTANLSLQAGTGTHRTVHERGTFLPAAVSGVRDNDSIDLSCWWAFLLVTATRRLSSFPTVDKIVCLRAVNQSSPQVCHKRCLRPSHSSTIKSSSEARIAEQYELQIQHRRLHHRY